MSSTNMLNKLADLVREHMSDETLTGHHDMAHVEDVFIIVKAACVSGSIDDTKRGHYLAAALLHEVDDSKLFRKHDYEFYYAITFLRECGFDNDSIANIIRIISLVSASKNGNKSTEDPDDLIVRDADRICALGKEGVVRCYQYTLSVGNPIITKDTLLPTTREELMLVATEERYTQYVARKGGSVSMTDHFYDKLLHIGEMGSGNNYLITLAEAECDYMIEWILKSNTLFAELRKMYPESY